MPSFDDRIIQKGVIFPKGAIVLDSNQNLKKLNYILNGSLSLFFENISNQDKFVFNCFSKSILFPSLLLTNEPNFLKIIANEDVTIDSYPFQLNPILFFKQNSPFTKIFIKSILIDFNNVIKQIKSFMQLYFMVERLFDNFLIFVGNINNSMIIMSLSNADRTLYEKIEDYKRKFQKNGGFFPNDFNINFFNQDFSRYLEKNYSFSIDHLNCDPEGISLMLSYSKIPQNIIDSLLSSNPDFIYYLFKSFSNDLNSILKYIKEYYISLDNKLNLLFSDENNLCNNIYSYIESTYKKNNGIKEDFKKFISENFNKISSMYKNYFNIISLPFVLNQKTNSLIYSSISNSLENKIEEKKETAVTKQTSTNSLIEEINAITGTTSSSTSNKIDIDSLIENKIESSKIQSSSALNSILSFTGYNQNEGINLAKSLNKLLNFKDKFADNSELRKLRKIIQKSTWELFLCSIEKIIKDNSKIPFQINLFLKFCILDERFVIPEHFEFLSKFDDKSHSKYPVFFAFDWLSMIYNGTKVPSVNDLGQTFDDLLKEEEKRLIKFKDPTPIEIRKLKFEVENLFEKGYRILTDSPLTAIPIFLSERLPKELNSVIITKKFIEEEVQKIVDIDYSIFYKESLFRKENKVEIFYQEVKPEFIILPTFGSKVIMWQDSSGNKYGPARFLIPQFFMGDFHKSLLRAFGQYRWEICKTFKGPLWADPVDGGLTGKYLDYINFYQKSQRLAQEIKEKIKEKFSQFRNDRDKFASDYVDWIDSESKGILKVNTLVREIFIFEIPFKKDTLLKLQRIPVFEKLVTQFINRRRQLIAKEMSKFKKFEDESGNYPPEITKYFEFLKS
ncbi:MAG: hypothetical protein N3A58_03195 [Spirochaetes bacterium]|nr:hypothetical protein [Spirochaetota bacterium]